MKPTEQRSCPCIEVVEGIDSTWSWILLAHNGRPIAHGVSLRDRKSVLRAVRGVFKAVGKAAQRIYIVPRSADSGVKWLEDWTRMGPHRESVGLPPGYRKVSQRTVRGRAGIRAEAKRPKLKRR